jgi:hypothetical protein
MVVGMTDDDWHSSGVDPILDFYADQTASLMLAKEWLAVPKEERKGINGDDWKEASAVYRRASREAVEELMSDLYATDRGLFYGAIQTLQAYIDDVTGALDNDYRKDHGEDS